MHIVDRPLSKAGYTTLTLTRADQSLLCVRTPVFPQLSTNPDRTHRTIHSEEPTVGGTRVCEVNEGPPHPPCSSGEAMLHTTLRRNSVVRGSAHRENERRRKSENHPLLRKGRCKPLSKSLGNGGMFLCGSVSAVWSLCMRGGHAGDHTLRGLL